MANIENKRSGKFWLGYSLNLIFGIQPESLLELKVIGYRYNLARFYNVGCPTSSSNPDIPILMDSSKDSV